MGTAPLSKPQILHPPYVLAGDAPEITNNEDDHPLLDSKRDHLLGCFMVSLANPPTMESLAPSLLEPIAAPPARAMFAWLGCSAARRNLTSLPIVQMQPALGADGSTGYQQSSLIGDHSVWVNDAKIHPCYSTLIQNVLRTWNCRRDREQTTFRE